MTWHSLEAIRTTPKAELHAHLSGCIPPTLVANILQEFNPNLLNDIDPQHDLGILQPVSSLVEYIESRHWRALYQLPRGKACLRRMFCSAIDSLVQDGVVYAELRHSPFKVAKLNDVSLRVALLWAVETIEDVRGGMGGIDPRLILGIDRANVDIGQIQAVLVAFNDLGRPKEIVGLDVSGDENIPIDCELARLLRDASDGLGLGVTIHAGEAGPAENIWFAIRECGATRIGHGLAAAQSMSLIELIKTRDICLEICLRSNILTSVVPSLQEHPVYTFMKYDVPFVLCTDSPGAHNFSLSQEYLQFYELTGRSDILVSMFDRQKLYAFGAVRWSVGAPQRSAAVPR